MTVENVAFIGDTVQVRGDIPIFIDVDAARTSLEILEKKDYSESSAGKM